MRLHQTGALLTSARSELIPDAGVLVHGTRIVAAGPLDSLPAGYGLPPDVIDLGDLTALPGLVDAHVSPGLRRRRAAPDGRPWRPGRTPSSTARSPVGLPAAEILDAATLRAARALGVKLVVARGAEHRPGPR